MNPKIIRGPRAQRVANERGKPHIQLKNPRPRDGLVETFTSFPESYSPRAEDAGFSDVIRWANQLSMRSLMEDPEDDHQETPAT